MVAEDGATRAGPAFDAGRLWTGGLATALVAALVAVVGVLLARGVFGIPVLAPDSEGTWGNASTARLAVIAAVAALLATGLMHVLLLTVPRPLRFFSWITGLLTVAAAILPFTLDIGLDEKIASGCIYAAIGISIVSLVSSVAGGAMRRRAVPPPPRPPGQWPYRNA